MKAGGGAFAVKQHEIEAKILSSNTWPLTMKGGRVVDIYKGKGDREDCDSSRGILLANHSFKCFALQMYDYIQPYYNAAMPETQFGGVSSSGTDFGTHTILLAIGLAAKL